ncbi:MAG: penicillin acylase family protein [Terriglobales bacterium]
MATSTLTVPTRRVSHITFRLGLIVLLVVVITVLGLSAWFYVAAHAALPQLDGNVAVRGLSARVTVTRDAQGVPHISADNLEDLFFAQGYVTAQDRLWQMDMTRRYAAGELAEILGPDYVQGDKRQRTLLIRTAAERAATALEARDRAYFEAYARGVNAYVDQHQGKLPIEFRVLRYSPRPWSVQDSLLVACSMVEVLNLGPLSHMLEREKILARLGPELTADLYPTSSWRDRPPMGSGATGEEEMVPSQEEQAPERQQRPRRRRLTHRAGSSPHPALRADSFIPGSNNWAISGAHTASGKPLLSNDIHLEHQIPNIWYEAHLSAGSFDVAGVTLPGLPFVIVGHNQRIAWGFTNIGPAVTDLFIETFNDRGEYLTPGGWQQPEHYREVIHVRDQADVTVDVSVTRHGPIVTELSPGEQRKLALKWTLHDPAAMQVPLFDLDAAQNWDEFRRALSRFGSPAQNIVYADIDGHIGYQAAGVIPIRAAGDGSQPVPGSDNAHEWTGYIPFDNLPRVLDPPSGIIATANNRVTPDDYPYVISAEWGPPYRAERIYRVLNSGKKFTAADMISLQLDVYSDLDNFCAQRFVYAIDRAANASRNAREAAEIMRAWDGRMTTDSAAASIVVATRQELMSILLTSKLGSDAAEYKWEMAPVWLENTILRQPVRWLPPKYASYDELLAAAVERAVAGHSMDRSSWEWGKQETIELSHPLFRHVPLLRRWSGTGRQPQAGDSYTVKQVRGTDGHEIGPSERMTVDFSDLDASTLNIVTGQSGQIFSSYYKDQWPAYYEGRTFPLAFSPSAVKRTRVHELVLEPARESNR